MLAEVVNEAFWGCPLYTGFWGAVKVKFIGTKVLFFLLKTQ